MSGPFSPPARPPAPPRRVLAVAGALLLAAAAPACRSGSTSSASPGPGDWTCTGPGCTGEPFSFVVFGDVNGGACDRNARFARLVARVAAEPDVAFYLSTGDLIDGWTEAAGGTMCFGRDPAEACAPAPLGNLATLLAPLVGRAPVPGLAASFYAAIGNHDDNWGSGWYPDPCGGGICELLSPAAYLGAGHDDVCSLDQAQSAHSRAFYYAFAYRNAYFVVLRQNDDYAGMLACNGSHPDCAAYCADPAHFGEAQRANDCYAVAQFDWLRAELEAARSAYAHVFVVAHSPLLGSGDNHGPNSAAPQLRALLEANGVDLYLNGHNHAYERTHAVRGGATDAAGTTYLTVGPAGAPCDGVDGAWFTAASYRDWTTYGDLEGNTVYTRITVAGATVTGRVFSLGGGATPVDTFTITR